MAIDKCPYCYRPLGTHTHDPILLPNGSKYKWSDDTHLIEESDLTKRIYKGIYQINEDDIIELQNELKTLEEENLDIGDRTTFSPLNSSGKFQITGKHIKEMRDSVEKLLIEFGLTKTDYFNYDEENNHIINPIGDKIEWTNPITDAIDLQKFQVKYIHIEDLRHFIQSMGLWDTRILLHPIRFSDSTSPHILKILTDLSNVSGYSICSDESYLYIYDSINFRRIRKYRKLDGFLLGNYNTPGTTNDEYNVKSICVDVNYVWATYTNSINTFAYVLKLNKNTFIIDDVTWFNIGVPSPYWNTFIATDLNYLYITGFDGTNSILYKINKSDKSYIINNLGNVTHGGIGLDDSFIYVVTRDGTHSHLIKFNKNLSINTQLMDDNLLTYYAPTVTTGKEYIYVRGMKSDGTTAAIRIYDKNLNFIIELTSIDGNPISYTNTVHFQAEGCIFSEEQYKYSLV